MTDHEITPPPELVEEWANASARTYRENGTYAQHEFALATQAARWGSDQELEACCEWADATGWEGAGDSLRKHRRPKPPSLAEQALEEINLMEGAMYSADLGCDFTATRRALERLQELENDD